jgi:hypothetical protein
MYSYKVKKVLKNILNCQFSIYCPRVNEENYFNLF